MLVLGEVRTCLLQHSASVPGPITSGLLRLIPGERVRAAERPMARAISPEVLTGIDCRLPTASGARYRGVGTVAAHGIVTGGRVLQGSAHVRCDGGASDQRQPWSHYLAKPGVVEAIGRTDWADITRGFLSETSSVDSSDAAILDVGAVCERLIGDLQMSRQLDHAVPFRSRRTKLRWAAELGGTDAPSSTAAFVVQSDVLRTFSLRLPAIDLAAVTGLCEDLAFHDWALSTLVQLVERSGIGSAKGPEAIVRLRPVIDNLLHLWMPGVHVDASLLPVWEGLERRPGFTRQWQATVARIRDQLALHTVTALGDLRQINDQKNRSGGTGDPPTRGGALSRL